MSHSLPTDEKEIFGEYCNVLLTRKQFDKLCSDFGSIKATEYIQRVDEYVQQIRGKPYSDCYATIRKWIREDNKKAADKEQEKKDKAKAEGQNSSLPPPEELERIMIEGAAKKDLVGVVTTNKVTKK